jgi:hypothetical protein
MSPPTSPESIPQLSAWLENGAAHVAAVYPTLAVKSPGLLVIVTDVVEAGVELLAANVPFVHGVI